MGDNSGTYLRSRHSVSSRARGFTLLELIVTLAVAAILLGVAVPSYRSVVQRNTIAANVNDLVGDLNYARSEAVTRAQPVFVCASTDQNNCDGDQDWSRGWIVYAAADPSASSPSPTANNRLRVHGASGKDFSLNANTGSSLSFDANGFAPSPLTFTASSDDSGQTSLITVAATGRIDTQ